MFTHNVHEHTASITFWLSLVWLLAIFFSPHGILSTNEKVLMYTHTMYTRTYRLNYTFWLSLVGLLAHFFSSSNEKVLMYFTFKHIYFVLLEDQMGFEPFQMNRMQILWNIHFLNYLLSLVYQKHRVVFVQASNECIMYVS